ADFPRRPAPSRPRRGRPGIDLRTLQELAAHSTPTLTARYSHRRLYDLAGAVERLPSFLPAGPAAEAAVLRATGTDASAPVDASCSPVAQAGATGCDGLRAVDTTEGTRGENTIGRELLILPGLAADCDSLRAVESRAGDGARTHDSHVGKVSVYHETRGFLGVCWQQSSHLYTLIVAKNCCQ